MSLTIDNDKPKEPVALPQVPVRSWRQHKIVRIISFITGGTLIIFIVRTVNEMAQKRLIVRLPLYEREASTKFPPTTLQKLKALPSINYIKLVRKLAKSSQEEAKLILDIFTLCAFKSDLINEILKGGHVCIVDEGKNYAQWQAFTKIRQSKSSHPSDGKQYRMSGNFIGEALFGQNKFEYQNKTVLCTWIQLERYPLTLKYYLHHGFSYLKYKMTSKNQGPFGESHHTHNNPIWLNAKALTE